MNIKNGLLAAWMLLIALPAGAADLVAPVYPGAAVFASDRSGCYLSRDAYEQVKGFYEKDSGGVSRERIVEGARQAFFEYMSVTEVQKYDSVGSAIGVEIFERPHTQSAAADVLGTLKVMAVNGLLGKDEYKGLADEYEPVVRWFFRRDEKTGKPMDELIYARYEKGPAEKAAQQNTKALAKKAEALMMQGKHQQALQLMEQAGNSVGRLHADYGMGAAGVEKWKKCLAEMKRKGYRTRIRIAVHSSKK